MTQFFYYTFPGNWTVDLGNQVARLGDYGGFAAKAEAGGVGTSTFIIDDPNANVGHSGDAILGLQNFYVSETDCAAVGADGVNGRVLFYGYTRERTYRRGSGSRTSLITGSAREIEVTLEDSNSAAAFRILNTASATLTGTVSKTSGNTTITGSGTLFLTELAPNFTISIPGGGGTDVLYVASIASNTSLTVVTAPTHSASGQVLTRVDANRPAETDVKRVLWLLSGYSSFGGNTNYFTCSNDAGWVDTSGPVTMDPVDYTGQTPADVIHDCALASGKNWWVGYWEATGRNSLWYANSNTSTTYKSLLRISNVLSDVDRVTTWYPTNGDAQLRRDPARTFAGIWAPYSAGHVYVSNSTTASTYGWRDGSASNANVKTSAMATANANRLLADAASEEDRITCSVQLPSSLATGIKVGQAVQCRFSHLPGYGDASFAYMRVASLNIVQDVQDDKLYTLTMELTPTSIAGPCLPGGVLQYLTGSWSLNLNGASPHVNTTGTLPTGGQGVGSSGYPNPGSPYDYWWQVDRGASPTPIYDLSWQFSMTAWTGNSTYGQYVQASDDGSTWTTIITVATVWANWTAPSTVSGIVLPAGSNATRYLRFVSHDLFTSGTWNGTEQFGGIQCHACA